MRDASDRRTFIRLGFGVLLAGITVTIFWWMPLAIGLLFHMLLDAMWLDPETLWWPLLGWEFTAAGPASAGAYLEEILTEEKQWLELRDLFGSAPLDSASHVQMGALAEISGDDDEA